MAYAWLSKPNLGINLSQQCLLGYLMVFFLSQFEHQNDATRRKSWLYQIEIQTVVLEHITLLYTCLDLKSFQKISKNIFSQNLFQVFLIRNFFFPQQKIFNTCKKNILHFLKICLSPDFGLKQIFEIFKKKLLRIFFRSFLKETFFFLNRKFSTLVKNILKIWRSPRILD